MRRILLVMTALAFAIPAAEAAERSSRQGAAASRQATQQATTRAQPRQVTQTRTTQSRTAQPRATLRPGDVRTQRSGLVVRGAAAATVSRNAMASNCTRRNGRTSCTPARAARSSIAGWQAGLPTANYAQRECPDGTFATLARGHDDVVRCMPL